MSASEALMSATTDGVGRQLQLELGAVARLDDVGVPIDPIDGAAHPHRFLRQRQRRDDNDTERDHSEQALRPSARDMATSRKFDS